ncbi:Mrp/NBP35 family ATP-binding protein [Anaerocellum diazotrophicum]|uniref:Iron-sulfur cluster carrier protein n=1 Tax=Caldicellulosiruptor diazotrophicus TaxID=2806205 RepID=A0ABN6E5C9_9FIRM|nr:Mrp/NBP35 family ATP-binding protein [Caldicellulosiruptor diazotrophicus]BCS80339.1 iron-sulfur cluster carrier protein [Caldicellulosiruptor diazotrophicus]
MRQNTMHSIPKNEFTDVKKMYAIVSGKGGVGKSLVTSLLAVGLRREGYEVGILDADITGPSIPKMFGVSGAKIESDSKAIYPVRTHNDIKIMSMNLLLNKEDAPVIWRGPLIAKTIEQFWTEVGWGVLDYLFIDMPPGTGDVALTVFQSLPIDGIIIVTSPQDLVSLIVKKAYNMAKQMDISIIGIIENMSYVICPHCGKEFDIFGKSKLEDVAEQLDLRILGRIPIDTELTKLCDEGGIEKARNLYLDSCIEVLKRDVVEG